MRHSFFTLFIFLCGCAPLPHTIDPIPQSTLIYEEQECEALYDEERTLVSQLAVLSERQRSNRNRDIALNVLVLAGSGAITRDQTDVIAETKGKLQALWTQGDRCPGFIREYPSEAMESS